MCVCVCVFFCKPKCTAKFFLILDMHMCAEYTSHLYTHFLLQRHRNAVILCCSGFMWATKESSHNLVKSNHSGKNNLLLRLKCTFEWRPARSKQPRGNPCGLYTFVALFRRHIVRHSKGLWRRLLLCQGIFPADKR